MNFRIGQGYDVHKLVEGRKLILGGVEIPHATGLLGHSDADALLHAITDALLGAVALGDIGRHFPDTDPRFKGADSRVLLRGAVALLASGERGCHANRPAAEAGAARRRDGGECGGRPRDWRGCGEYQGQDQRTAGLPRA